MDYESTINELLVINTVVFVSVFFMLLSFKIQLNKKSAPIILQVIISSYEIIATGCMKFLFLSKVTYNQVIIFARIPFFIAYIIIFSLYFYEEKTNKDKSNFMMVTDVITVLLNVIALISSILSLISVY